MSVAVIELSDVGIITYYDGGVQRVDPAWAVVDETKLLLGSDACGRSRLQPSGTHNQYWSRLSLDPLGNTRATIRHNADLAYAQLDQIWKSAKDHCDSVVLAVPGTFQNAQLGLLLGMTRELKMPVAGLVDAAVVAASETESKGRLLHLDVQLHRLVLTTFDQGPRLQRASVVVIAETGMCQLQDRWAHAVSDAFVRATRFDPMHGAESEQALFDQLQTWLQEVAAEDSTQLTLEIGGRKHTASLQKDQLVGATADIYPKIVEQLRGRLNDHGGTLLLSHRFEAFPGLDDTLSLLRNCKVVRLEPDATAKGALKHLSHISATGDQVSFVTSIPWEKAPSTDEHEDLTPTHIVHKGRAVALKGQGCCIGTDVTRDEGINVSGLSQGISRKHCTVHRDGAGVHVEDHSSFGTFVNELKVDQSTMLQAGDVLKIGDPTEEFLLISVVD